MHVAEQLAVVAAPPEATVATATRRVDVELLRIFAALLVVACHASAQQIVTSQHAHDFGIAYWLGLTGNELSRSAVPAFFAIAGWTILRRRASDDEGAWLGRRLVRLLVPLALWNVIFAIEALVLAGVNHVSLFKTTAGAGQWLTQQVQISLVGPGTREHLWFLYALLIATLILWLARSYRTIIVSKPNRMAFILVCCALIVSTGAAAAVHLTIYSRDIAWVLGYAVLGYVVLEHGRNHKWGLPVFLAASAMIVALTYALGYDTWPSTGSSPLVFMGTIGLLYGFHSLSVPPKWVPLVLAAARLTFGVYLIHPLVLDALRLTIGRSGLPPTAILIALWALGVAISAALVWLWQHSKTLSRALG
jgi:surface polysaccharide O-acyltransferase-like enzyme